MPAWKAGAWAADAWAGTAWDESAPTVGQAWFATAWAPGAWGTAAWASGGAAVLTITDITEGPTSIVVTWTGGTATHYRINGGTATAMPDGTSPDTITGLTANTEYFSPGLELSGDGGSTWSDPVAFGTTNEGGGGEEIDPTPPIATLTSPTTTAITETTATIGCTTDAAEGTLYVAVQTSATPPSAAAIKAGTGFVYAGNQAISSTGAKTFSAVGLLAATTYYHYHVHNTPGGDSNVLSSASFTTSSPPPPPANPTITIRLLDAAVSGSPLPSLTGIEWGWWDSALTLADTFGVAPTNSGTAESTDGSGNLAIVAPDSGKTSGQQAFVLLHDPTGPRTFGALLTVD